MERVLPELLAPAGSLERLKVAFYYGADAVYLGGENFGLRSAADNFTSDELKEGVSFAKERGKKVYVVLNAFLHDNEMNDLPSFLLELEALGVSGVIVSDLGVIDLVSKTTNLPIHLSTQMSCLNSYGARFWKDLGIDRVILGREASIEEARRIKERSNLEVELFIHGALCISYSGNCIISNFTQGRDSNRGGCAHSCRFEYVVEISPEDEREQKTLKKSSFFMSSKDLMAAKVIPALVDAGIDSLKIEGRMKGTLYLGTVVKIYRELLDRYLEIRDNPKLLNALERELEKTPHRSYCLGNLERKASSESFYDEAIACGEIQEYQIVGDVLKATPEGGILISIKNSFPLGTKLEIMPFKGETICVGSERVCNLLGEVVDKIKPNTVIKIPYIEGAKPFNIVRMKRCC
jgi:putative protease